MNNLFNTSPYNVNSFVKKLEQFLPERKFTTKEKLALKKNFHLFNADVMLIPGLADSQQEVFSELAKIVCRQTSFYYNQLVSKDTTQDERDEACRLLMALPTIDQMTRIVIN